MIQTTQSGNIMNEGNRKVEISQGGQALLFGPLNTYWHYQFSGDRGWNYDGDIEVFRQIGRELVNMLSDNRVIAVFANHRRIKRHYKERFMGRLKWTPPEYKEDSGVNKLKQQIKSGEHGEFLWADCMYYETKKEKLFDIIPTEHRFYFRDVLAVFDRVDYNFIDAVGKGITEDGFWGPEIIIYPHSDIEYCEQKEETIKKYIQRKDFVCQISLPEKCSTIIIEPNPEYMTYEDLLEIMLPLFKKIGYYIEDRTNPYIKNGFTIEHNEPLPHKYSGFEFFD